MGSQHHLGIYIGLDSPSIINFLEPSTSDLFTARFKNYHFNETVFSSLGIIKASTDGKRKNVEIFSWNEKSLSHLNLKTLKCENEVQCIIYLEAITNKLFDEFNDVVKVTKSHISIVNALARIVVPKEHVEMDQNVPT